MDFDSERVALQAEVESYLLRVTGRNTLDIDAMLLNMMMDQWQNYKLAQQDLKDNGFIMQSGTVRKTSPSIDASDKALQRFMMIMREFQLTPQSRSNKDVAKDIDDGSFSIDRRP